LPKKLLKYGFTDMVWFTLIISVSIYFFFFSDVIVNLCGNVFLLWYDWVFVPGCTNFLSNVFYTAYYSSKPLLKNLLLFMFI